MAKVNQPNAKQDYQTSPELLAAVQARYGKIDFDAACTRENAVAEYGYFYPEHDALAQDWAELQGMTVWCNPPFGKSGKFAERAAKARRQAWTADAPRVLLLVQAAVDTQWWEDHVRHHALVLHLAPRPAFIGCAQGINRALALCVYGPGIGPGEMRWVWRPPRARKSQAEKQANQQKETE